MAAAAILNFKNFNFWSRNCKRVQYLMQCTKFHQNRSIFHWDMAILWFSKWRPSAMLDSKNLHFLSRALVDLPFCYLMQNFAEIGQSVDDLWPKKRFSRWRPPPSWISRISISGHVTVTGFNIWCSVPNFIKIRQFFTEIWRFNDFQNGGRPPSWILHIWIFLSHSPCQHAILFPRIKFRWNRTIGRWFMAKKAIFKMATAAILNFKNFNFWSRDNICCSVPNFIKIGWFCTEIW